MMATSGAGCLTDLALVCLCIVTKHADVPRNLVASRDLLKRRGRWAQAPSTGAVNSAINVSWTVKNQGNVTAPADWRDFIYLSTDNIFENFNDTFINSSSITTKPHLLKIST